MKFLISIIYPAIIAWFNQISSLTGVPEAMGSSILIRMINELSDQYMLIHTISTFYWMTGRNIMILTG
jgi:hypothetical protein